MLFIDDEARRDFHASSTLLQVVCQLLESEVAPHHLQLELVNVEEDDEKAVAMLVVANESYEDSKSQQAALHNACTTVNKRFKRHDKEPTALLEPGNFGLVTITVTSPADLASLN